MAKAYAEAEQGDGTRVRPIVDEDFYGRDPETGAYDPFSDLYLMLTATEQRYLDKLKDRLHTRPIVR